jgi:hypothetical protein
MQCSVIAASGKPVTFLICASVRTSVCVSGDARGAVHGLHWRVRLKWKRIRRFVAGRRGRERGNRVSFVTHLERRAIERQRQVGQEAIGIESSVRPGRPGDRQRGAASERRPVVVRHHRDTRMNAGRHRHDVPHARHLQGCAGVETQQCPAQRRRARDGCEEHAGHPHVHSVLQAARDDGGAIKALDGRSEQRERRRILQRGRGWHRQSRCCAGQ